MCLSFECIGIGRRMSSSRIVAGTRRISRLRAWIVQSTLILASLFIPLGPARAAEPPSNQPAKPDDSNRARQLAKADQLYSKALASYSQAKYGEAVSMFEGALGIRRQVLGDGDWRTADCWGSLANSYYQQGDYAQAEPLYAHTLSVYKRAHMENHPNYALNLRNLSGLYCDRGDYAQAESLTRQALEVCKKVQGENHPDYANGLQRLAGLYEVQGDYARAEPLYRQSLEILKKASGKDDTLDVGCALHNLAGIYYWQADDARAESMCCQALEIEKRTCGENHPAFANSLDLLAAVYLHQRDYARAQPLFRQVLEIRKKLQGENHPDYARSISNLANVYFDQRDYARAAPGYLQVGELLKKTIGEKHPDYASSLENLANVYREQGDCARAEPLYRQASGIWRRALGENHPYYAKILNNLALLYAAQGNYLRAGPLYRQAAAIVRRHVEATAVVQSDRQQLAMLQSERQYLDNYLATAVQSGRFAEPAYCEVLAWKGMVLRRQRLARAAGESPELLATFSELQRVAAQLSKLAWATPDPKQEAGWRLSVALLSLAKERLEAELSSRSAAYRQANRPPTLEELQAALPQDTVLVDFLAYWHNTPAGKGRQQSGKTSADCWRSWSAGTGPWSWRRWARWGRSARPSTPGGKPSACRRKARRPGGSCGSGSGSRSRPSFRARRSCWSRPMARWAGCRWEPCRARNRANTCSKSGPSPWSPCRSSFLSWSKRRAASNSRRTCSCWATWTTMPSRARRRRAAARPSPEGEGSL